MRKAAFLFICSLTVLLFLGVGLVQSLMVIQRIAAVSDLRGTVTVARQGREPFVPLGDAKNVLAGDVIRTGADGTVTLRWVDNNRVMVLPNTTLQVLKCQFNPARQTDSYLFKLNVGRIWVRVLKALSEQSKFEITTPTATAAVRGTVFSLSVTPEGTTRVTVIKGRVELKTDGRRYAVSAGETAQAGAGQTAGVGQMSPQDEAEWREVSAVAQPGLLVTEPDSERLPPGATSVHVAGVAERGATVRVNGQPVELNLKGAFQTQLPVPEGATTFEITIVAEDSKGFQTVVKKRLRR